MHDDSTMPVSFVDKGTTLSVARRCPDPSVATFSSDLRDLRHRVEQGLAGTCANKCQRSGNP